jgi:hypothetical protein
MWNYQSLYSEHVHSQIYIFVNHEHVQCTTNARERVRQKPEHPFRIKLKA